MFPFLANVVWPALDFTKGLLDASVIVLTLIVEAAVVWKAVGLTPARAIGATLLMNLFSWLFGLVVFPVLGFLWEFADLDWFGSTYSPGNLFLNYGVAVIANVLLEGVALLALETTMSRRNWAWLAVANAVTVGFTFARFVVDWF